MKKLTPFGVPLQFHWSILALLGLFIWQAGLLGVVFFACLVLSTLFHEYSHVWIALRNGAKARNVIFFALGAAAMIELPNNPKKEVKIAVAGPVSSLILSVIFFGLMMLFPNIIFGYMFIINLILAVFNALPIYPMDGGRIMCGCLSAKMAPKKALKITYITSVTLSIIGAGVSMWFGQWFMGVMFAFILMFGKQQKDAHLLRIQIIDIVKKGRELGATDKEIADALDTMGVPDDFIKSQLNK